MYKYTRQTTQISITTCQCYIQ